MLHLMYLGGLVLRGKQMQPTTCTTVVHHNQPHRKRTNVQAFGSEWNLPAEVFDHQWALINRVVSFYKYKLSPNLLRLEVHPSAFLPQLPYKNSRSQRANVVSETIIEHWWVWACKNATHRETH